MPFNASIFIPHPVNIYITEHTFVKYDSGDGIGVGLIMSIDGSNGVAKLRRFLSWAELIIYIGEEMFNGLSFWPDYNNVSPLHLCDTDISVVIPFEKVIGLAFVFHVTDPILDCIQGIKYTYQVSSVFLHGQMTIYHQKSFLSFPYQQPNGLPTCFPSSLFKELLTIKQRLQICLSTTSKNDTFSESCRIDNVNLLTWFFIIKDLPREVLVNEKNVIVKRTFFQNDMYVLEKRRCKEISFHLHLPEHLSYAQSIFGTFVGIGSRKKLKCSLIQKSLSARTQQSQVISVVDEHNVIPFEAVNEVEYLRRGIILKYVPEEQTLTLNVKFQKVIKWELFTQQLTSRNISFMPGDDETDQRYPLHCDTEVFDKKIYSINISTRMVELQDGSVIPVVDVINEINRLCT